MGSHFSSEHFGIYECLLRKGVTPNNICFSLPKNISKGISQKQNRKKKALKEQHKIFGKEAKAHCTRSEL